MAVRETFFLQEDGLQLVNYGVCSLIYSVFNVFHRRYIVFLMNLFSCFHISFKGSWQMFLLSYFFIPRMSALSNNRPESASISTICKLLKISTFFISAKCINSFLVPATL